MNRYDIYAEGMGEININQDTNGEWVKWMDAIAEVEEVREAMQAQLDLIHVKIIKIREVIAV